MKSHYEKMSIVSLGIGPSEGVCGSSVDEDIAIMTMGQPVEEIRFDDRDGSGNFIYNNTWEEAN